MRAEEIIARAVEAHTGYRRAGAEVLAALDAAGLAVVPKFDAHDGHARLCQGREYTCTCGYDERVEALIEAAAAQEKMND